MATKQFRKDVQKLKKEELLAAVRKMMDEEFKVLSKKEYAATYEQEHQRRASDTDATFAVVAHNKNIAMLPKMKKKDLEDIYIAYLEIKDTGYRGPTEDVEPKLPAPSAT